MDTMDQILTNFGGGMGKKVKCLLQVARFFPQNQTKKMVIDCILSSEKKKNIIK